MVEQKEKITHEQWLKENGYKEKDRRCATCEYFYAEEDASLTIGDCSLANKESESKWNYTEASKVCDRWTAITGNRVDFKAWKTKNLFNQALNCGNCKHMEREEKNDGYGACVLALKQIDTQQAEIISTEVCRLHKFDSSSKNK